MTRGHVCAEDVGFRVPRAMPRASNDSDSLCSSAAGLGDQVLEMEISIAVGRHCFGEVKCREDKFDKKTHLSDQGSASVILSSFKKAQNLWPGRGRIR